MQVLIIFSAFLVVLAQCGYPVPDAYPASYPVAPSYPSASVYSASSISNSEGSVDTESNVEFRKRAKARTVQNRKFHRRALQPIRRFQQKKQ
ncbi:uncharacterized protein CELE_Y47D7A.9 [Caenorhabditis elegans]|uniref:Secreted protein n=1 Tax=Caenorhabditis elegans TaxID=6239 RepID=Q9N3U7_CAEEL|nr:Secreted protein [Caenorhabditis elegans]CCD69379.1 Secreted protein [Caenorhabditis elegans]|eukprot:NP_504222.1 Uncharacterized protein CELE_Y47D7A.9 [Caenorhabditis elegans]